MPVSRDAVLWAFRLVLGREPESEEGIRAHQRLADEADLVASLLRSAEFRASRRFEDLIALREDATVDPRPRWRHTTRAAWRAVVFGNCQANGIGRLLQAMTGDVESQVFETTPKMLGRLRSGDLDIGQALRRADIVFVQAIGEVMELVHSRHPREAHKLRQIPPLSYSGFHPDIVYITDAGSHLGGPMGEYHSSIVFWAWRQGLRREQAAALFRPEVYEHLDFAAHRQAGYQALVELGRQTDLPMAPLIDRWHRRGCWMHTVNHPKLWALADVVAAALRREGIDPLVSAADSVDDPLSRWPVWPLYPGLPGTASGGHAGDFVFKLDHGDAPRRQPVLTLDLPGYVDAAYAHYDRLDRSRLACPRVEGEPYASLGRFVTSTARPWQRVLTRAQDWVFARRRAVPAPPSAAAHPYEGLPDARFWRRAVAETAAERIDPVVATSFRLSPHDRVATAGSCFAQHLSNTLQRNGLNYFVADAPPGMDAAEARRQGYGVFSARFGNVYTTRQLVQLFDRAHGDFAPRETAWQRPDGRWVDPFRPQVEAAGHDSPEAVRAAAHEHLAQVRRMFAELDVFVFTLGLTEAWHAREDGAVYPLAPGVVASRFDDERHAFVNFDVDEVTADLDGFVHRLRGINPSARLLLTVSPVPLIATYEAAHVLASTTYSKSVLRAAAARVASRHTGVDYFPSYEIVTMAAARGEYFADDLRSVTDAGVAHVMRVFMSHYGPSTDGAARAPAPAAGERLASLRAEQRQFQEVVCDEEAIERHRH